MSAEDLRSDHVRAVFQLINECREIGDDPVTWRTHLFSGIGQLISADIVVGGEMSGCDSGNLKTIGTTDWGWGPGFDRMGWLRALELFDESPFDHPLFRSLIDQLNHGGGTTLVRRQLMPDKEWYRTRAYEWIHHSAGVDATIHSWRSMERHSDTYSGWIINRAAGRKSFNSYERRVLAYLHAEVSPLIGGALAQFDEPSPSQLAPRVRQVLMCILEGDSDKQISLRLHLSIYTVNQYLKTIYRHFHVSSRAELLSRWIRRGWSAKCAWVPSR